MEYNLDLLAIALESNCQDLDGVRPLSILGHGFRSLAVETLGGMVFLVGKSSEAAREYERLWNARDFIRENLGDLSPVPRWRVKPCVEMPYGALGYQKLPGTNPEWGIGPGAAFARDLGEFMARLHGLSVADAERAGIRPVDSYVRILEARDVVMPVLTSRMPSESLERIKSWWTRFADDDLMATTRLSVCHHDLWHGNLLRSPSGRLSGVLDLAHLEIGDPAHDLAAPHYFGAGFMDELLRAYRESGGSADGRDVYRARRYHEAREFGGLAWAIEHDDDVEIDEAVGKILRAVDAAQLWGERSDEDLQGQKVVT